MTYSATKFEVTTSYGLGGDTFTRNVTDTWMDGPYFGTKLIYPFFLKKIVGIISTVSSEDTLRTNYIYPLSARAKDM